MIIVSAGMPRTASTLFYNIMRLIVLELYGDNIVVGWEGDLKERMYEEPNLLVKIHIPDKKLADKADIIFYSYRDVRDSIASFYRKFNVHPTLHQANKYIQADKFWRSKNPHLIRYEEFMKDPMKIMKMICEVLEYEGDPQLILDKANAIFDKNPEHEVLVHHPNHRTTDGHGGRKEIPPRILKQINRVHKQWFIDNHYPPV